MTLCVAFVPRGIRARMGPGVLRVLVSRSSSAGSISVEKVRESFGLRSSLCNQCCKTSKEFGCRMFDFSNDIHWSGALF